MESKDKKNPQDAIVKKMNKSVASDNSENVQKKEATDKQASIQDEYITSAGEEGADMSKQPGSDRETTDSAEEPEEEAPLREQNRGKPRGQIEERDNYNPYSEYERGFRDSSRHAARWYSEREFEREQNRFSRPNRLEDDYNEVYNPTGMNTERYGRNYGRGEYDDERRSDRHQRYEDSGYRNRNIGYSDSGHRGSTSRGGGYFQGYSDPEQYQGSRQSYPNQDQYDYDRNYEELRRNPDMEDQRQGYVNPDSGGYEEGGYDYDNRPRRDYYTQEQGLSGKRSSAGNRHGASPSDYEEARDMDYGRRSNYNASDRNSRPITGSDRDEGRRAKFRRSSQRSRSDWYDDPYRNYDWSSRGED